MDNNNNFKKPSDDLRPESVPSDGSDPSGVEAGEGLKKSINYFDVAPLAIIITDGGSVIQYINQYTEKMFGYSSSELVGKQIEILLPDQLRSKHVGHRNKFMEKPYSRPMGIGLNLEGRKKNGIVFQIEIAISYHLNGENIQIISYISDITKRIQLEEILEKQNSFLSALHETSLNILSQLDLKQVLSSIIAKATSLLECRHGQIYLLDKKAGRLEKSAGIGGIGSWEGAGAQLGKGFLGDVINTGSPIIEMISKENPSQGLSLPEEITCLMGVPIMSEKDVIGAICVAGEARAGKISSQLGTEMLTYFSQLASIAIQNAQLFDEVEQSRREIEKQKARMDRDLKIARTLQVSLLPHEFPTIEGWSFSSRWKPAHEVAGDYYDFILRGDGCFDLTIADVTDKGLPAALFMAHSKTLLRSALEKTDSLLEGVLQANETIIDDNVGPFVTMFLTRINPTTGDCAYINAGHDPALVYHSESDTITEFTKTGLPLGVDKDIQYQEMCGQLKPSDFIVLYTDGVPEAMNQEFKRFGKEALLEVLTHLRHETSDGIAQGLLEAVEKHIGPSLPSDDIAILVARRLPLS
jgi:sigma-B regulation protein RsbU (phosphoserine phosphatase)